MADSSQKFIARNRAPRVQIEYDVELYGAEKKVQLPFVMGVMSDLAGKSNVAQPAIADRKFLEIDVDNFDERMRAMAPRAAFSVPNTLTGEGNLAVDLTFESMADFTPGAVARKVDALRPLLEARQQLEQLMTYMDGKSGAEDLIEKILTSPSLLSSLAGQGDGSDPAADAALESLRQAEVPHEESGPDQADVLSQLAARAPEATPEPDASADILAGLKAAAPLAPSEEEDRTGDVLAGLAAAAPEDAAEGTQTADTLADLAAQAPVADGEADHAGDILSDLARAAPIAQEEVDIRDDALAALAAQAPADEPQEDADGSVLSDLAASAPEDRTEADTSADVLAALAQSELPEADGSAETDAILSNLERAAPAEDTGESVEDVLAGLEPVEEPATEEEDPDLGALLGDLEVAEDETGESVEDVLAGLEPVEEPAAEEDDPDLGAMLGDLEVAEDDTGESVEDVLAGLEPVEEAAAEEDDPDLGALLGDLEVAEDETGESVEDVLAGLEPVEEASAEEDDTDLGALLGDLEVAEDDTGESVEDVLAGLEPVEEPAAEEEGTDLEALLGELDATDDAEASEDDVDLADLLGETETTVTEEEDEDLDLEALLAADEEEPAVETSEEPTEDDIDLDALLAGDDEGAEGALGADDLDLDSLLAEDSAEPAAEDDFDLDALLAEDVETDTTVESADAESDDAESDDGESDDGDDDLDDLLAGLDLDDSTVADDGDDLDALLSGLDAEAASDDLEGLDDLDALLGDLGEDDGDSDDLDLDSLLGDLGDDEDDGDALGSDSPKMARAKEPELAYGTMSADRPEPQKLARKRFRLAVFGDFTGRASKGQIEIGEALAARKPMVLDPDTFEDVIESFATELVLPIGKDGAGIAVKLGEFDDLHPDELYDNVALFSELVSLRKQLQSGVTKDHAMKTLASWAEAHGTPARAPKSRSGGNAVPADKRLSDFQRLIGDTDNSLRQASPVEEMLARVVGPHIRALPDPNLAAMQDAVDQALSDAMRLVLHHPEFQSVEAQWRSLDLIQRSIEVDDTLDVMLYDVSAEELAADLAAHEDLSQSGFVRLLTEEPMDEENGRGAYSALIGLYTFEETPPHAELLGRFARVAAHVDAPFLAAITPGFWDHAKEDRPKIVADAWDTLTGMSEAGHLGLLTPRFLLRRPYGAKGEPIDPFDFEEFTQSEGLRGMLWGNPVVLAAILMAKSFKENGASLQLGSIMSLGDMPFHFVTDRFGDQVALPCTERNVDLDKIAAAKARGFMPIAGVRGRDEIRLTSFNSLRGEMLLGPWTGEPAPAPSPPDPRPAKAAPEPETDTSPDTTEDGDDLDLDFDLDFDSDGDGGDDDLDALLASFDDDDDSETDGDIDADLEALLNDL